MTLYLSVLGVLALVGLYGVVDTYSHRKHELGMADPWDFEEWCRTIS